MIQNPPQFCWRRRLLTLKLKIRFGCGAWTCLNLNSVPQCLHRKPRLNEGEKNRRKNSWLDIMSYASPDEWSGTVPSKQYFYCVVALCVLQNFWNSNDDDEPTLEVLCVFKIRISQQEKRDRDFILRVGSKRIVEGLTEEFFVSSWGWWRWSCWNRQNFPPLSRAPMSFQMP